MKVREALLEARRLLQAAGSDEDQLEAELLLMHALGTDRVHLYQRLDDEAPEAELREFRALLKRRLAHEPLPYITGHKEFFGLDFEVSPAVLIPRPETETLVELVVRFVTERFPGGRAAIADVGTGSGAVAVALAVELPGATVVATDISAEALAVAARNAVRNGVGDRIVFAEADLLPHGSRFDVIAANLPYIPTPEWERLPAEIREHEPRAALDGGPDGLDAIRRLLQAAPDHLQDGGALFAEIGADQGAAVRVLAEAAFPGRTVAVEPDLAGRDRVLAVR